MQLFRRVNNEPRSRGTVASIPIQKCALPTQSAVQPLLYDVPVNTALFKAFILGILTEGWDI